MCTFCYVAVPEFVCDHACYTCMCMRVCVCGHAYVHAYVHVCVYAFMRACALCTAVYVKAF